MVWGVGRAGLTFTLSAHAHLRTAGVLAPLSAATTGDAWNEMAWLAKPSDLVTPQMNNLPLCNLMLDWIYGQNVTAGGEGRRGRERILFGRGPNSTPTAPKP